MLRNRFRWRALAVLGALLSVAIDWPTGLAMPAVNLSLKTDYTKCKFSDNGVDRNCSEDNNNNNNNNDSDKSPQMSRTDAIPRKTTTIDHFLRQNFQQNNIITHYNINNSYYSGNNDSQHNYNTNINKNNYNVSSYSDSVISSSSSQQIVDIMLNIDGHSSSRQIRQVDRASGNYSKRKRKKNMMHLTADSVRNFRTHNSDNFVNHTNSDHRYSEHDVTTISLGYDNATLVPSVTERFIQHLSRTDRSIHSQKRHKSAQSNLDRNERSANLSHISGSSRKIQLYIKNRYIQVLPDGTINGTENELSDYTIFQRFTVDVGQIKIQGIATCLFLCMDPCGTVYASREFHFDCVFNESMEQHYYNTYSSTYNSNSRGAYYLALNRHGEPRKLKIAADKRLGKLAMYAQAITETVPQEHVEQVIARTFGANRVKHGTRQLCDTGKPLIELTAKVMKPRPNCTLTVNSQSSSDSSKGVNLNNNNNNNNNTGKGNAGGANKPNGGKKKKKRRRCRPDETENENCLRPGAIKRKNQKQKCGNDEECKNRKKTAKKKKGVKEGEAATNGGPRKNRKLQQQHQTQQAKRQKGANNAPKGPNSKSHKGIRSTKIPTTTSLPTTLLYARTTDGTIEEDANQEEQPLSSAETQDEDDDEDSSSVPSIGGHTQLVGADEFFYDNEFDV